jgi:two-component system cell cycle response regulator DivK
VNPKTVLIVEDNFDNRTIYAEILRFAGYRVLEAANGEEGVRQALEHTPDLILMDLSMPVLDGWGAIRQLRALRSTLHIPVFALSAHVVLDGDYEKATTAGFLRYLTKPIDPKDVLDAVREQLGSGDSGDVRTSGRSTQARTTPRTGITDAALAWT